MSVVAAAACGDYAEAGRAVERALSLLGGPETFASSGMGVLVKPNMLAPHPPERTVTTHPAILDSVLGILSDIGAKAVVGDSPGYAKASRVASVCGFESVCRRHNVPLIELGSAGVRPVDSKTFRAIEIALEALDAERIWNLPKWKTHTMMGLTLGVKNLYGCLPGTRKVAGHMRAGKNCEAFALMLLDIWMALKPSLTILDGIDAMEGPGPSRGNPVKRGLILASDHAPSLDWEATRLSGFAPEAVPTVRLSLERGILDVGDLETRGDRAQPLRFAPAPGSPTDFSVLPETLKKVLRGALSPAPVFDGEACKDCGICSGACPAKALEGGRPPRISKQKCIRCYCCQELCPEGAVSVPSALLSLRRRRS